MVDNSQEMRDKSGTEATTAEEKQTNHHMHTTEAIAALREKYPDRHINVTASLDAYSNGRLEAETTLYIGGPNGTSGKNYTDGRLELLVRRALEDDRTSIGATTETIDQIAEVKK